MGWRCTVTAPINMAVIKYWGKRDEELILPSNSSLSATLDYLTTTTTIVASPDFSVDSLYINNISQDIRSKRLEAVFTSMRQLGSKIGTNKEAVNMKVIINSSNNFPTASGLASSASGYAALVYALATLYGIDDLHESALSGIARMGSGSACRSIYGGWVRWDKGILTDGSDSKAVQTHLASHWPNIRIVVAVVNDQRKDVGSTFGMRETILTSELIQYRTGILAPKHLEQMENAITNRDFTTFAELTMKESNQFHATCLDTYPPIFYLNDISKAIITLVHAFNSFFDKKVISACYTFDAGPNACLFALDDKIDLLISCLLHFFPTEFPDNFIRGLAYNPPAQPNQALIDHISKSLLIFSGEGNNGAIKYLINTKVGQGPTILEPVHKV